jgi:hypothetical protein
MPPGGQQAPGGHEVRLLHLAERLLTDPLVVRRYPHPLVQERPTGCVYDLPTSWLFPASYENGTCDV